MMAMGPVHAPSRFLFILLLTLLCFHSTTAREIKEGKGKNKEKHGHLSPQRDPSLKVFFKIQDLKLGNKIPIYFSLKIPANSPHLLPRAESDSIPFSTSRLPEILDFFSFPKNSPQAKAMENTLSECEIEPLRGETKFCATSLESMLDSTRGVFGLDSEFELLTTNFVSKHTAALQNYTVMEEVKEVLTPKMLACHTMPYPYAVYYCHGQVRDHKLFEIKLEGENGERVDALGVCHIDTSQWDPDHVAFWVLGTSPGQGPVCHFFPADNLVWVVSTKAM